MTQFQGPNPTKLFGARRLLDGNLLSQGPPDHSMAPNNLLGGNQTRETRGTPLKIDMTSWKIIEFSIRRYIFIHLVGGFFPPFFLALSQCPSRRLHASPGKTTMVPDVMLLWRIANEGINSN